MSSSRSRDASPPGTGALLVGLGVGLVLVLLLAPGGQAQPEPDWDAVENTTLVDEVGRPVDLALGPDGDVWWNAHDEGDVVRYDPDTGTREVVYHVEPTPDLAERGLIGLALDPEFATNGVFYIYYTVADPDEEDAGTNHLARIEDGRETRLLDVPANGWHNGGKIVFDDEGRLFVSTGENEQGWEAQDPGTVLGSILHLHPNGTPAADKIEGYVYSMGHRNVFGLAYDGSRDRLFATENSRQERDEVNLIEAGNNYGWPECEGYHRFDYANQTALEEPCEDPAFTDPIGVFYDNRTIAPTGATVFAGDLYWGALKDRGIHRMVEDPATGEWSDHVVFEAGDEVYDLETRNGSLYYAARGEIVRLDVPMEANRTVDETGSLSEVPGLGGLLATGLAATVGRVARRRS